MTEAQHPERSLSLAWTRESEAGGGGREDLTVAFSPGGCVAVGHVVLADPEPYDVYYRVECDDGWRSRYVSVAETLRGRSLAMRSTGDGRWVSDDARMLPGLADAIDVDISVTPFSNTLPVRRLQLAVGESADIVTAYVDVALMRVSADPQRYTRVESTVYRYESRDSDFVRDLRVDEEGFVLEYPGWFRRL
ncbi:putative glycolipid-binding domain-containing protein [Herbiconiux sp. YIM B11900]|uniref:putative glycolipid-binding domain-containing protein n=1 Tax=Herbiconiux sp. YIM B11900 TaxID=3404131 RepID=UPI003F85D199